MQGVGRYVFEGNPVISLCRRPRSQSVFNSSLILVVVPMYCRPPCCHPPARRRIDQAPPLCTGHGHRHRPRQNLKVCGSLFLQFEPPGDPRLPLLVFDVAVEEHRLRVKLPGKSSMKSAFVAGAVVGQPRVTCRYACCIDVRLEQRTVSAPGVRPSPQTEQILQSNLRSCREKGKSWKYAQ